MARIRDEETEKALFLGFRLLLLVFWGDLFSVGRWWWSGGAEDMVLGGCLCDLGVLLLLSGV